MNKSVKIVSFYSFQTDILEEFNKSEYVKLFCGNIMPQDNSFLSKMDFIEKDDHDNLCEYNDLINEMTGMTWIGRNYDKIGNPDFIGTAHYRRYYDLNTVNLDENTIICHKEIQPFNVFQTYSYYHVADDLRTFNRLFSRKYQEHAIDLNDYMNQNIHALRNMFIMPRSMFYDYYGFIQKCIDICLDMSKENDYRSRDKYQMRALSFILERMTGFWIFMKEKNGIKTDNREIVSVEMKSPYQRN